MATITAHTEIDGITVTVVEDGEIQGLGDLLRQLRQYAGGGGPQGTVVDCSDTKTEEAEQPEQPEEPGDLRAIMFATYERLGANQKATETLNLWLKGYGVEKVSDIPEEHNAKAAGELRSL